MSGYEFGGVGVVVSGKGQTGSFFSENEFLRTWGGERGDTYGSEMAVFADGAVGERIEVEFDLFFGFFESGVAGHVDDASGVFVTRGTFGVHPFFIINC